MKKVMVFVMVSAFLTANVFAQEGEGSIVINKGSGTLTIGGTVKTGLRVDDASNIYAYSDDIGDGTAVRAEPWFRYENGPVGIKIGLRGWQMSDPDADVKGKVQNGYGWLNLFDSKARITAGIINDAAWGTESIGDTETDDSYSKGSNMGVRISIMPIDGLSFGVFWSGSSKGGYYNDSDNLIEPATAYTLGQFFGNTVIGAKYVNDAFALGLDIRPNLATIYTDSDPNNPKNGDKINQGVNILAGFKITAVQNLLVVVDGEIKNLGADEDYLFGSQSFYVKAQYNVNDQIMVGAKYLGTHSIAADPGPGIDKADWSVLDSAIRLFGTYKINSVATAGLEAQIYFEGFTDKMKDDYKRGHGEDDPSAYKGIHIKPSVTFAFSEGLTFVIFDKVTIEGANYYSNPHIGDDYKGKSWVSNQVQFDFIYSY